MRNYYTTFGHLVYLWGLFLAVDIWCTVGDCFWLWTFGVPLGIISGCGHLVYLLGLFLAGGMTENEITSLCVLSLYLRLDIPTISAVHFLAFAFLAITFLTKGCREQHNLRLHRYICLWGASERKLGKSL